MKTRTLVLVVSLLLAQAACQVGGNSDGQSEPGVEATAPAIDLPLEARSFAMGTAGFVPAGYPEPSDQAWQEFFQRGAASYGGVFGVHISPSAPKNKNGVPEQVQLAFEQIRGVEVYVALASNPESGLFNQARADELVEVAVAIAEQYQPLYLSLGVESNTLYLTQPDNFNLYLEAVARAYAGVKEVSPETRVMNNFQLERMRGATALMGEQPEPHWELIDRMSEQMDLVSFTVYPFLNFTSAQQIPPDYLAEIRQHTDLPVVITETGWPSEPTASGVDGSPEEQRDYLVELAEQANSIEAETVIWVFPHDAEFGLAGGVFDDISLKANDGSAKPAFAYWQALLALPRR